MKNILWLLLVVTNISLAQGNREYPMAPNAKLTPGELCTHPDRYRYPENIAYCERAVEYEEKEIIFEAYRRLGFRLNTANRSSYKIDHYIPLCAGGSNNKENLWPQHISLANMTDALEALGCSKMALGKLSQANFVKIIKRVKNDVRLAPEVTRELSRL